MAINCGNCKGSHDTAQQVRECYSKVAEATTPDEVHPTDLPQPVERLATEKQVGFIKKLLETREIDAPNMVGDPSALSIKAASAMIELLLTKPVKQGQASQVGSKTVVHGKLPKPGTYTVGNEDKHWTIRLAPARTGRLAGKIVAKYLNGPDNDSDYMAFGEEVEDGIKVWYRFRNNEKLLGALGYLLTLDDEKLHEAGFTYALQSGNCYVCGRTLTVPASITRGIGPICAGKGY